MFKRITVQGPWCHHYHRLIFSRVSDYFANSQPDSNDGREKIIVMRADWYETRTPRRQTAFLPPVTTIWILQGSQCSPHFFLPKLNSIASAGWFKMQIRYSTNAPEDHNIILNPGFKICRLKWSTVLEGNRITLEHSPKHHLGTQPFLIALEHKMIHLVFPQPTHKTSNLLTGAAVWKPRAFQSDKKKAPIPDFVLTSSAVIPIATLWPWNSLCCSLGGTPSYISISIFFRRLELKTNDSAHAKGSYFSLALAILMLTAAI